MSWVQEEQGCLRVFVGDCWSCVPHTNSVWVLAGSESATQRQWHVIARHMLPASPGLMSINHLTC